MRHSGLACGIELADHAAFGLSRAEVSAMDPQQRLILERGYAALHNAGADRAALVDSLTGVFLGIHSNDFADVLATSPLGVSVYGATGASLSVASGRLSFALGLNGPCVSFDTACSAALVANHAGEEIRGGPRLPFADPVIRNKACRKK